MLKKKQPNTHLKEYSEYGMDDIANDLISIQANLEIVRLKVQYDD